MLRATGNELHRNKETDPPQPKISLAVLELRRHSRLLKFLTSADQEMKCQAGSRESTYLIILLLFPLGVGVPQALPQRCRQTLKQTCD